MIYLLIKTCIVLLICIFEDISSGRVNKTTTSRLKIDLELKSKVIQHTIQGFLGTTLINTKSNRRQCLDR